MSREDYELSNQDGLLPRGAGDPDYYGYPGEELIIESQPEEGTKEAICW